MCGCGECTVRDLIGGKQCPRQDNDELCVLLPRSTSAVKSNKIGQTRELQRKFWTCNFSTWKKLNIAVNGSWWDILIWGRLSIEEIVLFLNSMDLSIPTDVSNVLQLQEAMRVHVSWFNFEPILLLTDKFLSHRYPQLRREWDEYLYHFKQYCNERNLKDYVGTIFKVQKENVFYLEVDEMYFGMKLVDVSRLRDSLSYALQCHNYTVQLISFSLGSLVFSFCYCCDDYLDKFQLTYKQLTFLAQLNICRVLSLRDAKGRFVYRNIQNHKVAIFIKLLIMLLKLNNFY